MQPYPYIVIDGVGSILDEFGVFVAKGSEFPEAVVRQRLVSVPCGPPIDLSEAATGDVVFDDVEHRIVLVALKADDIYECRRKIVNALSGRFLTYRLSWDPGYSFNGRWFFGEIEYYGPNHARFVVTTRTEPYRTKGVQTFRVNAAGGIVATLESGRMPVCPVFDFASETIVSCNGITAQMQPGSYKVNDLWLVEGANEIYINSYLGDGNVDMSPYAELPIAGYSGARISDLIWDGVRGAALTIGDWADETISLHSADRAVDAEFAVDADSEKYAVYIEYEWKDL